MARKKTKSGRRGRGYVQKPKSNIYTMLLILAFMFLCGACGFLWLELQAYNGDTGPTPTATAPAR